MKLRFLIFTLLTPCVIPTPACTNPDGGIYYSEYENDDSGVAEVAVSSQALGQPELYGKVNSADGEPLTAPAGCDTVSCWLYRAVRSITQSRHPNSGKNGWACGSSNVEGRCRYNANKSEHMLIQDCVRKRGTPTVYTCVFGHEDGPNNHRVFTREGSVNVGSTLAAFYFDDGGLGSTNYVQNAFWYTAAR